MGAPDSNGIYIYTFDDLAAPFEDTLNLGMESVSDEIANDRARLTALEGMGSASNWTPTFTNLTVGNGTLTAYWTGLGDDLVAWQWMLVFGSTTAISNTVNVNFPTQVRGSSWIFPGGGWVSRGTSSTGRTMIGLRMVNATNAQLWYDGGSVGATSPLSGGTWVAGDVISAGGVYFRP